jgi:hypothetical protein
MNIDFDTISRGISHASSLKKATDPRDHNYVRKILRSECRSTDIISYEQYDDLFRLRHDVIHWLICEFRDLPFGEKHIHEIKFDPPIENHKYYSSIMNQSPDIFIVEGKNIKISELTVSRMKQADAPKLSKYQLLLEVLKDTGYNVKLEVIVINTSYSYPDHTLLSSEYKFSDTLIYKIYHVIEVFETLIHQVHETDKGREWAARRAGQLMELIDLGFSDEDVVNFHSTCKRKCFIDDADLHDVLTRSEPLELTEDDDHFIDLLVNEALKVESKLTKTQKPHDAIKFLIDHHQQNSFQAVPNSLKSFMPLPYFESRLSDSARRTTMADDELFAMITGALAGCSDPLLSKISTMTSMISKIKLTPEIKFSMALEGPGRRNYIRKGSLPHIEAQNLEKRYWLPLYQTFNNSIEEMSFELSSLDSLDPSQDLTELTGKGLKYIAICQSIFREICVNALRKERRQRYILKPTGVQGVFIFLNKGPKLRTGENLSIIWFKVICLKEYIKRNRMSDSWIYKTLHDDGNVMHSRWLSTDANRLDHYLRCYDKILMSYFCYQSLDSRNLRISSIDKSSNTLGMIIMIYMEDKRSTSKMLQDVRYLIMSALSMFNYYDDILRKFVDPIRTPLQSYLLTKILDYVKNDQVSSMILSSHFGKLNVESGTGDTFDKYSGAQINLPRILTCGSPINFKQMLCEMYFTMLFNKNQDDPTHASFQILSKILEGEKMLEKVKLSTMLHVGAHGDDQEDALTLINDPKKNQFSRRAITIASKLQSSSKFNRSNNGVAHIIASRNHEINKTLDNFATYKSSSVFVNAVYNVNVRTESAAEQLINSDLMGDDGKRKEIKVKVSANQGTQNPRRRCIEGVSELIQLGYVNSFDLIKNHLLDPFRYQIFKKNQIGGVREILILDIKKRVLVNVLESISRVICRDDDREMLTHGDKKNMLIRDLIRHLKRGDNKKIVMNYNFDKTKWAPSFMPIQFLYMFVPFKKMYPSLFRFIALSLISHSNKEFILPERLIRVWNNDPENSYHHRMDENLQKLKEEYLTTKKLSYVNESNMGQGILHYTSSYFHLCVISLRDEIYKKLCIKVKIDPGEWRDLVSSDDSYTAHALPMDSVKKAKIRIILFMKAQEITERVMNVWTSTSKSSISMLIYEFNSLFGSNLTMFPTIFKFALASVHPQNTDSFFRMVKEGYIASRQIVENGGSLELYMIAQKLNKIYAESIYHTHMGGQNDLQRFLLLPKHLPYQLGIYPIGDPGLMIMFGPEFHNYEALRHINLFSEDERKIFLNMHTLVKINDPEIYSAINSIDDVFVGVNRIEARMGPIQRLEYIKRALPITWETIQSRIINDPLLLFNKPKNKEELEVKVYMKLFQHSAAEALRTTAASIYYGRVSASVTANAFIIPFVSKEVTTYSSCIMELMNQEPNPIDLTVLYPHKDDYELIRKLSPLEFDFQSRDPLETQNIRTLQTNKLVQRIHNPIVSILNHFWSGEEVEKPNSYNRDWINLQESVKVLRPTLEQTLDQFPGDKDQQIRALLLVILRLMSYNNKPMKAIIYGPSSRSFDDSYLILKQQNMYTDRTSSHGAGLYLSENITRVVDKLSYAFNIFALSVMINEDPPNVSHLLNDDDINSFFMDNTLSQSSYKKVLLMLIYHGHLHDLPKWSLKTKVIFHQWEVRGKQDQFGNYHGNFQLKLQLGHHILKVHYYENVKPLISLIYNKVDDPEIMYELLQKAIEISGFSQDQFTSYIKKGNYLITSNKILPSPHRDGIFIETRWLPQVKFNSERVVYQDGSFVLFDNKKTIIMRTVEGLLHTNFIPTNYTLENDILIQGLPLSKLIPYRPFNTFFSIEHIPNHELLSLIRTHDEKEREKDLHVNKPKVSRITNERLGTQYPERGETIEFSEIMIDPEPMFEKDEATEIKTADDLMSSFLQISDDDLLLMAPSIEGNFHDVWFSPNVDLNLIKTMTRQRMTYQPKKILERLLSIKYQIVTKMITNVNLINRRVILDAQDIFKDRNIVYCLIYSYDSQFSNKETPSPDGCELIVFPDFDKYYFPNRYTRNQEIMD